MSLDRSEVAKIAHLARLEVTGAELDAPIVVSNADLKRTVLELVGEEHFSRETVERVRGFRMSLPLFAVYAGLDVDLVAQGLPNTNHWLWGTTDIEGIYAQVVYPNVGGFGSQAFLGLGVSLVFGIGMVGLLMLRRTVPAVLRQVDDARAGFLRWRCGLQAAV